MRDKRPDPTVIPTTELPPHYRTIVADPPWQITSTIAAGGRRKRSTAVPYSFLSLDDIKAIPVADYAHPDGAHLFLWATRKVFREGDAVDVARAWGFEPVGEIIWGLRNVGTGGKVLANDHEPVLVARRGKVSWLQEDWDPVGVWFWRQLMLGGQPGGGKAHSAKPEGFLDKVEQVSPGPYLEMFSRRCRMGWDTWGNEALHGGVADVG